MIFFNILLFLLIALFDFIFVSILIYILISLYLKYTYQRLRIDLYIEDSILSDYDRKKYLNIFIEHFKRRI